MEVVSETFRDRSMSLINRMMFAADAALARNRGLPNKPETSRTSIVLAAFAKVPAAVVPPGKVVAERAPTLSVVTNAQANLSQHWSPRASKRFHALIYVLGEDEGYFLHIAGQRVGTDTENRLHRDIRRVMARTVHPETLGRVLARTVQTIAKGNPDGWGERVLHLRPSRVAGLAPGRRRQDANPGD